MSRDTFFCKLCQERLDGGTTKETWKNLCIHIWLNHPEYIKDNKIMEPVLDDIVPPGMIDGL